MSDESLCPVCGGERPAHAPDGLCPRCLLRNAFQDESSGPPDVDEVSATLSHSPAGASGVLATLAATVGPVPRILLRDTLDDEAPSPVVQPASAEMPDLADRAGRLQLLGEIAHGGMGAILKGRDADLGRDLAVKALLERHRDQPEYVRRFVEEAQIAGQLQHPGVVPVYELGAFPDRRPYFAMKLVKGRTLAAVLADRKDLAGGHMGLLATLHQVGQTVAYAHARGVIHRDLKPSNVMVGSFGEVQVMDWGLAKVLPRGGADDDAGAGRAGGAETVIATARSGSDSDLSQAGSVLGTPAYMAPEQARGEVDAVDERADVFALGSILCEVLTARPAFVGRSSGEIQRKSARGDLADARSRLEACGADPELVALARDCLAPERDDRPRDASAFAGRLGGYLSSIERRLRAAELERAASSARAEEAQARIAVELSRRRRTVALAASLLAIMALGGLSVTYLLQQRQARLATADRVLGEARTLLGQARARPEDPARWRAALAAAGRVDAAGLPGGARARLDALTREARAGAAAAAADRDLLDKLVDIRSAEADDPDGSANDAAYADAFRAAGIDVDALGPEAAGARIRSRPGPVALALAAALDDWASERRLARPKDEASWRRVAATARVADPDPRRDELRSLWERADRKAQREPLRALAEQADVMTWPVQSLNLLASALAEAGDVDAAVALLRRAAGPHAGDIWTHYHLARLLEGARPPRRDEAIRHYTAARALRPETAHELAHALEARGEGDEAIAVFQDLKRLRPGNGRHLLCLSRALRARGLADEARAALDAAVTALRAAIRLKPDFAQYHYNLGGALSDQGKPAEAEAAYRAAIRLKPDNAPAHDNLGVALGDQGKPAEAEAAHREAIRLKPDYALARANLGVDLSDQGKHGAAEAEHREAIRLEPDLALAHDNLGALLHNVKKDYPAAEAEFRAAIRLKPADALAHNNLGNALRAQGKHGEAEAAHRAAIRLKPDDAGAHNDLGLALKAQGKFGEAETEFRAATRLKPDEAGIHINLGDALADQGKHGEAEAAYRAAIRLKPDDATAHSNLGNALRAQGKHGEAEAAYRAAIRLNPDDALPHNNLGAILCDVRKDYPAAEAEFRAAIGLKPDLAMAHFNLGNALKDQGKIGEAVAAYRVATRLKPDDANAHNNLAFNLLESGDLAGAMRSVEDALRLDPEHVNAATTLAEILLVRGRFAEAVPALERAAARLAAKGQLGGAATYMGLLTKARWLAGHADALSALATPDARDGEELMTLDLAARARAQGRPALAARLYEVVLAVSPARADDLQAGHRHRAARAAVLAGAGKGEGEPLDEGEKARWRNQALDWLKADLARHAEQARGETPRAKAEVTKALQDWKAAPDFAGVRDPDALATLPEPERDGWRALWAEVDRLLKEAGKIP